MNVWNSHARSAIPSDARNAAPSRTVVLLIRHGHTDAVGHCLVSRLPGVSLSAIGRAEVERLRAMLSHELISAVYASPLERAMETAERIAHDRGVRVRACDGLNEVDFGEWTGKTFSELSGRDDWRRFNEQRSSAPVPAGEAASTVQARIVRCLRQLHARHPGQTIAAVSHADVIRCALLHYGNRSLDTWQSIEVEPASVSAVSVGTTCGEVLYVNRRVDCHLLSQ